MSKCLLTKLNGIVENPRLPKLEECVIEFNGKGSVHLALNEETTIRVVDGVFSDSTYSQNNGTSKTVSSLEFQYILPTSSSALLFLPKKKITSIIPSNCNFDVTQMLYMPSLISPGCGVNCISPKKVDIQELCNKLAYIQTFQFASLVVKGDIAGLRGKDATWIRLEGMDIYGDISNITSNADQIFLSGTKIGGELSSLTCEQCMFYNNGQFTWKNTRPSSKKILPLIGNANLGGDVDAMLINQANCVVGTNKTISVLGNRTSASDAAVATLQQNGYTVSVTPA